LIIPLLALSILNILPFVKYRFHQGSISVIGRYGQVCIGTYLGIWANPENVKVPGAFLVYNFKTAQARLENVDFMIPFLVFNLTRRML
jgi:hypothetical protein